jgi:tRNA (guanine-N7-)-methyltransferase
VSAEEFIIKRKRKKYKFARFAEFENCFEASEFTGDRLSEFRLDWPLVVELGAGSALFSVELARQTPDKRFIAVDVKADRLMKGAGAALEQGVGNIVFVRAHANQLPEVFTESSIDELWLTFPDPFPKKRHTKHRMTHPRFLRQYRNLLKSNGIFHFKTDNHDLFHWSLEQFVAEKLHLTRLTFDLHDSDFPDDYKIMTTYEKRFVAEGLPIYGVEVAFN